MAEYSKTLTKLMDDVVHKPSDLRSRDVADLSSEELSIYMNFLDEQKQKIGSEFEKHVKKKPPVDPFKESTKELQ